MSFFSKPAAAPAPTTSGLATQLQSSLNHNAERLEKRKDQALSSFRSTVKSLRAINEGLQADVNLANEMIATCTARKASAEQEIKDNEAVCARILDIIGDVEEDTEEEDENTAMHRIGEDLQ